MKLREVWITVAYNDEGEHPEVGLWADEGIDQADNRASALNARGSWLWQAGYEARVIGPARIKR